MNTNECIFFQLAKTYQLAMRFSGRKCAALNITSVQGMILSFLFEEDEITSRQLGERAHLDSATLTGILDRLEGMELIERRPNPKDRRAILICLKEEGRKLAGEFRKVVERINREFLQILSPEEETIFREILRKIRERDSRF